MNFRPTTNPALENLIINLPKPKEIPLRSETLRLNIQRVKVVRAKHPDTKSLKSPRHSQLKDDRLWITASSDVKARYFRRFDIMSLHRDTATFNRMASKLNYGFYRDFFYFFKLLKRGL